MSFRSLIKSNVTKAFNQLGDIAVIVTLKHANAAFDFGIGDVTRDIPSSTKIKAVYVEKVKRSGGIDMQYIVNADSLPDPTLYDTLVDPAGKAWKLVQPCKTDGYLTYLTLAGGGNE